VNREATPPTDFRAGAGQRLYRHARTRIPGCAQLLGKRPEQFLPEGWPAYYQRAEGCTVWDLDGRAFLDFTSNGIGTCLLGYADPTVNAAVTACVARGSMCTLNSPAEVELADRLCAIHPWASKVRYARTGGEAMAIAVRLARAATRRSTVAFCGYHGWSDWYLVANLGAIDALSGHLLPGLDPDGVPRSLHGSALPFRYNQIAELEQIVAEHGSSLAAIVMEPMRHESPRDDFLVQVRALADRTGAVLIFDEITSGWRTRFGGLPLALGVDPDVAVFAKAMSNGFPMAAIIGREGVMDAAQETFVSSSYCRPTEPGDDDIVHPGAVDPRLPRRRGLLPHTRPQARGDRSLPRGGGEICSGKVQGISGEVVSERIRKIVGR